VSTNTTNFNLIKPELTDQVSQTITDTGTNMDTIDTNMQIYADHITSTTAHASQYITYTGSVSGTEVQGAINQLKTELDAAIIGSGTSPAEVVAARNSIRTEVNATLDGRLDNIEKNQGQITTKTGDSTLVASERGVILVDTSLGDVTLDLPDATGSLMMVYTIIKTTSDSYVVIVDGNGSQTISGNTTHRITNQWDSIKIVNDGSNWVIIAENDNDLDLSALILTASNSSITSDTLDGSDNKNIYINGGGGEGTTRGSQIRLRGNEYASNAGELTLRAGTVATGDIVFYTGSGSERFRIAYNGDLTFSDLTANRALYIDASNNLVVSDVTDTELSYLDGVTSSIQSQFSNKQDLDADLTALAGLSGTGLISRTAANTYQLRTIVGTTNKVSVSNGDGVSGSPTIGLDDNVYLGTSGKLGRDADNLFDFSTDNKIVVRTNSNNILEYDSSGQLIYYGDFAILSNTSDSSDNANIYIASSGSAGSSRGAYMYLAGNEHANTGQVIIEAGDVSGGSISFKTNNTVQFSISDAGVLNSVGLSANRALVTDGSKNIVTSNVSDTQINYLVNTTSDIQGQINNKQDLDADLTALAGLSTTGIIARTAANTYELRTITGTANNISVSNGDGVSGNPTLSLPSNVYLGTGTIGADASTRIEFDATSDFISFTTNTGTQRLYIDQNGILAIGGNDTESWISTTNAVEFYQSAIYSYNNDNVIGLACNAYYSGTGWKRKATNAAGRYQMLDGIHYFYVATSDTEDTTIGSWSNSLKVDATSIELPNLTANRALYLDASSNVLASNVTDTELGYVSGVTSSIQTQINNKQPLDGDLTSLSALSDTGLVTRIGTDAFTNTTIEGTSNEITVTNGDGLSSTPINISLPDVVYLGTSGKIGRNANNLIDFSSADHTMIFRTNGADTFQIVGANGDFYFSGTNGLYRNTVDGTDNERMTIGSAGASSYGRGSYIFLNGNEYASDGGDVTIVAGDAANAEINFYIAANKALTLENDLDAYFYANVGIGRSPTGSYALDVYKSTGTANQIIKSADNTANLALDGYKTDNTTTSAIDGMQDGNLITRIESLRDTAANKGKLILRTSDGSGIQPVLAIDSSQNTYIGDAGTTNYAKFVNDGELTLHGTARIKKSLSFSIAQMSESAPAGTLKDNTYFKTNEVDIGEGNYLSFALPQDWDSSTDLTIYVSWICNETYAANSGELRFQSTYGAVPKNSTENIDSPTHSGTIQSSDINLPASANYLIESTIGSIPAASLSSGDLVGLVVTRIALVAGNNPGQKPRMVNVRVEYTANKLGTAL